MKNERWILVEGEVKVDVSHEEFVDRFITWLESNGWGFGGTMKEQKD